MAQQAGEGCSAPMYLLSWLMMMKEKPESGYAYVLSTPSSRHTAQWPWQTF